MFFLPIEYITFVIQTTEGRKNLDGIKLMFPRSFASLWMTLLFHFYSFHPSPDFANPKNNGGRSDDEEPFCPSKGNGTEYLSAKFYNDNLSDKDDACNTYHADGVAGVLEYRMVGAENAGIEQVPELEHHEDGEEGGQCGRHFGRWQSLDVDDEAHQDSQEASAYT